ncbi:MAG: RNA 2',3'-cyclic phosphodiesterase [Candidatus Kerfeldbacteria bacterium CG_4_10_14_0_8_um_filter_42_10]|uniref:RNA 2',3'-cyclic phosphodiesterase n=1 Tax=Candidatus Kerfeldbacteria bacterium CG_4_10_14_0_8_um_filter_42_10 TaxID=2014248 RepID=A0A2M7RLC0_9BACT|nr:MAG: RNA 2',3'-cyclic phosphodiesterase [Candidatus Kerfeldbacteria bacterium CG_4_10_14_0_8_um_filter_42_10]
MRHRTFVAITPPREIKKKLAGVIEQLKKLNLPVKTTAAGNIHLTLKFLDSLSKEEIELVDGKLKELFVEEKKLILKLDSIKLFPSNKNAKVISANLADNLNLIRLEHKIRKSLEEFKFLPKENRRFHSHITLARIIKPISEDNSKKIVNILISGSWQAESIELRESDLSGKIPHYSTLASYRFKE